MAKTNIGTMPCSECGKEVVVKANENDTLSYSCAWCDDGNYAKSGTGKHLGWKNRLKPLDAAPSAKPEKHTATGSKSSGLLL